MNSLFQVLDLLSDSNQTVADAVLTFAREVLHKFDHARSLIVTRLIEVFPQISPDASTHRSALWLLGEYCSTTDQIIAFIECVKGGLGDLPLVESEQEGAKEGEDNDKDSKVNGSADVPVTVTRVTADGTYATQTAFTSEAKIDKDKKRPPLRQYLYEGNFFIGAALASDLVKASLRYSQLVQDTKAQNAFIAEAMLILTSIMHYGQSGLPKKPISEDDVKKMSMCLKVIMENLHSDQLDLVGQTREALDHMLAIKSDQESRLEEKSSSRESTKKDTTVAVDDCITFGLLTPKGGANAQKENIFETSLAHAVQGSRDMNTGDLLKNSKLAKVTQLTGLCDPVYAEAYVQATEFDISLDVLIVNQTSDMLQNCLLELATLGDDLKLLQKPTPVTLAPFDFCNMKATIKVGSDILEIHYIRNCQTCGFNVNNYQHSQVAAADNGTIFGNIVYDVKGTTNVVVLNDIKIDIIDYIMPSVCSDEDFRKMWAEFEWENKVR